MGRDEHHSRLNIPSNSTSSTLTAGGNIGAPQSPHTPDLPPDYNNLSPPPQSPLTSDQISLTVAQQRIPPISNNVVNGGWSSHNTLRHLHGNDLVDATSNVTNAEEEDVAPPAYESLYPLDESDNGNDQSLNNRPTLPPPYD